MSSLLTYYKSSIGKKQIVAVTGLMLIIFILGHLAGNLLIFLGPDAFNGYAKKLAGLRPGLLVVESALGLVFLTHILTTALLVLQNIAAKGGGGYAVKKMKGAPSLAVRVMPYTGSIIFLFLIFHLLDFTFSDHHGDRSVLWDGQSYGLYGVVVNAFADPVHSSLYILAMFALAFHLAHGVQSFMQTLGFNHPRYTPVVQRVSNYFALFIALAYSSIPFYVYNLAQAQAAP